MPPFVRRLSATLAAAALVLFAGPLARADNALVSGDGVIAVAGGSTLALGDICLGATTSKDVSVAVSRSGNYATAQVFKKGTSATVTASPAGGFTALSVGFPSGASIGIPAAWDTYTNTTLTSPVTARLTLNPTVLGAVSGSADFAVTGVKSSDGSSLVRKTSLAMTANVVSCNTPPSITVNNVNLEGNTLGGRILAFGDIGTASDVEDGAPTVACTPSLGSVLPLGMTTVTCTATDSKGATGSASGAVTIVDTTKPIISGTPSSLTVEATSAAGATVSYTAPSASDVVWGAVAVACMPSSGSTFALGSTTVTCSATDGSGNAQTSSFAVNVRDTIAPAFAQPADVTAEATSAAGAVVTFTPPSATDAVSGVLSGACVPGSGSQFALGDATVSCQATDGSGNTGFTSFVVHVKDTTAPTLSVPADITVEATSSAGAVATFAATAVDLVDASPTVLCVPSSGSTFPLGSTTVTCTATDASGNTSDAQTFTVTVRDTTPPSLVNMPTNVTVEGNTRDGALTSYEMPTAIDLVDPAPGVSCDHPASGFYPLGATQVTCTATDASGNHDRASFSITVVDTTKPTITFVSVAPSANGNGWNNTDVTVTWSCSDIVWDVADATVTVSSEGSNLSATGTCVDGSLNSASDSHVGINIDKTAPSIMWNGGPADGGTYYYGQVPVDGTCSASDALSGPGTCMVAGYSTAFGSHTLTATAYDLAGNMTTETRSYTVLAWTLKGFYQPVDMNGVWNVVKNGSTVPLKFEVYAGATELTDVSVVKSFTVKSVSCPGATAIADDIELTTTGGTQLRYDSTGGQFIQNWQTPKRPGTCWVVTMTTVDGSFLSANFKLK